MQNLRLDGSYSVSFHNQRPIFWWCVDSFGYKHRHHKDKFFKEIGS